MIYAHIILNETKDEEGFIMSSCSVLKRSTQVTMNLLFPIFFKSSNRIPFIVSGAYKNIRITAHEIFSSNSIHIFNQYINTIHVFNQYINTIQTITCLIHALIIYQICQM